MMTNALAALAALMLAGCAGPRTYTVYDNYVRNTRDGTLKMFVRDEFYPPNHDPEPGTDPLFEIKEGTALLVYSEEGPDPKSGRYLIRTVRAELTYAGEFLEAKELEADPLLWKDPDTGLTMTVFTRNLLGMIESALQLPRWKLPTYFCNDIPFEVSRYFRPNLAQAYAKDGYVKFLPVYSAWMHFRRIENAVHCSKDERVVKNGKAEWAVYKKRMGLK